MSLFRASYILLVALSSAARDLPSVFDANCSLSIFRSLLTLRIDSAVLILSAIFVLTSLSVVTSSVCRFAVPSSNFVLVSPLNTSASCYISFIFCLKLSYLI